jgi:uncharacterized protein (DUF849 family)
MEKQTITAAATNSFDPKKKQPYLLVAPGKIAQSAIEFYQGWAFIVQARLRDPIRHGGRGESYLCRYRPIEKI